jgi:predicted glutamine amidotransferase
MCGLVGVAGDLTVQHEKILRTMLVLDSIRGEDSTGIAVVSKHSNQVKIAKQVGDPFQLFDHKSYDKALGGAHRALIGHNRYATSGAVNRNTAHPFENDSFVGVHNGTLKNKWKLADANNYTVDSENLYHHMHKHGLPDLLNTMDGAWALVWWDKDLETLNFLRNKERPLFVTNSKDDKALFWASEAWMLHVALNRTNIDYEEIYQIPEDMHISLSIAKDGKMGKPVLRKAPSTYVAPVTPPAGTYQGKPTTNTWDKNKSAITTALDNVISIAKKEDTAEATQKKPDTAPVNGETHQRYETAYIGAKRKRLELLNITKDQAGEKYIACFDPEREVYEIRLYADDKNMVWEMIGEDIIADIQGYNSGGRAPGRGYYRVNPDNFSICVPDVEPEGKIVGPTGKFITESEFKKQYDGCAYCSAPLIFGDVNRFTTGGECVCPACAKNPEVLQYVSLH